MSSFMRGLIAAAAIVQLGVAENVEYRPKKIGRYKKQKPIKYRSDRDKKQFKLKGVRP